MTDADQYCDICNQRVFTKEPHEFESEGDYYNSIPELALWHEGFGGYPVFVCMGCCLSAVRGKTPINLGDRDRGVGAYVIKMLDREEMVDFCDRYDLEELVPKDENDEAGWKYLAGKITGAYSDVMN